MLFIDAVPAAGGVARTIALADTVRIGEGTNPSTTSVAISDAVTGREALICVYAARNGATAMTSVTLYGVTATLVVELFCSSNNLYVGWYRAAIPTGTTGDLVITFNGNLWGSGADIYRCEGLGTLNATTTLEDNSPGTSFALGVNTANDDAVLAAFMHYDPSQTTSWTAGVTEATDATVEGNNTGSSGFVNSGVTAATPRTVTVELASAPSYAAGVSLSIS